MNSNEFDRMTARFANTTSRRQALKLMAGGILGGAAMTAGIKGTGAQRPVFSDNYTLPVVSLTDTVTNTVDTGTLSPTSFFNDGGVLSVVGDVLNSLGEVVGTFTGAVTPEEATCDILNLVLGPLELDVLGLVVEIPEPVILNIFAQPGDGNLLGNLLCAVAGLLDRGGPLSGLSGLLNNILRALGLA